MTMMKDRISEFLEKVSKVNSDANRNARGNASDCPAVACNYVGVKRKRLDKELENILSQVTEVWEHVNTLKTRVDNLKAWYGQVLRVSLPRTKKQRQLEDQVFLVKTASDFVLTKLRDMELENAQTLKTSGSPVFVRIKHVQHSALKLSYVEIMNEYQIAEVQYDDILQACVEQQVDIAGSMFFEYDIEEMEGQGCWTLITPIVISNTNSARIQEIIDREKRVLADTDNRNDEIAKLENSVRELQELFLGMTLLVESHGRLLEDSIEKNMETAGETVRKGKGIFQKAREYKRKFFR